MAWWTCAHCTVVFFWPGPGEVEPSNGHGIACTRCWELPCQGPDCRICAAETRRQMDALDRIVNEDAEPTAFHIQAGFRQAGGIGVWRTGDPDAI